MNYYDLSDEEQKELEAVEQGDFVPVDNVKQAMAEAEAAAKNTLNKTRNINIRLSERDLYRLKAKAVEEGIPYQTLASSILHKAAK